MVSVLTKVHLSRYEGHYALPLGRKKGAKLTDAEEAVLNKKRSKKCEKVYKERQKDAKVEQGLTDQFMTGKKIKKLLLDVSLLLMKFLKIATILIRI